GLAVGVRHPVGCGCPLCAPAANAVAANATLVVHMTPVPAADGLANVTPVPVVPVVPAPAPDELGRLAAALAPQIAADARTQFGSWLGASVVGSGSISV